MNLLNFNNSNNPKAAFNDLINNCLNGTSNLYPYNNFIENSKGISQKNI